jgi:anti-sigma factor RsiW
MRDLEFDITQYLDGTLDPEERAALELRLAADAEARAMLVEQTSLTRFLRDAAPLPTEIRWDALADHLSSVVAAVPEPATSYRLVPRWLPMPLALAASLLIAAGVGISFYLNQQKPSTSQVAISRPAASSVLLVSGPVAETASGGSADVSIGPPPQAVGQSDVGRYSDDLVSRPSHLVIASGVNFSPETSSSAFPY